MKPSIKFQCLTDFYDGLGLADAAVEFLELSKRELILQCSSSSDPTLRLKQISAQHRVKVDAFDAKSISTLASRFYVISVFSQTEEFLNNLKLEIPGTFSGDFPKEMQREPTLDKMLFKLDYKTEQERKKELGGFEYDVYEYYRHIRNRAVHSDVSEKSVPSSLVNNRPQKYAKLQAPNTFDNLGFDDFILFTRIAKAIATKLCVLAEPVEDEFIKQLFASENSKNLQKIFNKNFCEEMTQKDLSKRMQERLTRLDNAISGWLRSVYGVSDDKAPNLAPRIRDLLIQKKTV